MKQLFTARRNLLGYSAKISNLKIFQTLFISLILLTLWVFERWHVLSFDLLLLYILLYPLSARLSSFFAFLMNSKLHHGELHVVSSKEFAISQNNTWTSSQINRLWNQLWFENILTHTHCYTKFGFNWVDANFLSLAVAICRVRIKGWEFETNRSEYARRIFTEAEAKGRYHGCWPSRKKETRSIANE